MENDHTIHHLFCNKGFCSNKVMLIEKDQLVFEEPEPAEQQVWLQGVPTKTLITHHWPKFVLLVSIMKKNYCEKNKVKRSSHSEDILCKIFQQSDLQCLNWFAVYMNTYLYAKTSSTQAWHIANLILGITLVMSRCT